MKGKCPKCEKPIESVELDEEVKGNSSMTGPNSQAVIAILCPHCQTVLSAQINPFNLKAEIIDAFAQNRK